MYCGHIGIGLGAKGVRPTLPLALIIVAAFGPDWVETVLIAAGFRDTSAWSHSLPATAVIVLAFALATFAFRRSAADAAFVGGVCLSHSLADLLTGHKPMWLHGPIVGLGLYGHPIVDFILESAVIVVGWLLYRQSLETGRRRNHPLAFALLLSLLAIQAVFDWKFTGS